MHTAVDARVAGGALLGPAVPAHEPALGQHDPRVPGHARLRGQRERHVGRHDAELAGAVRRPRDAEADVERLGRTRVIQRRFNVSVPRARVPGKASTLRDRSER